MGYLLELTLPTAEGCSSTDLFQNSSIISSRCSGYWQITLCWFCKQFTIQAPSSDISSSEWNEWHHNRYVQGRRTYSSTSEMLFCVCSFGFVPYFPSANKSMSLLNEELAMLSWKLSKKLHKCIWKLRPLPLQNRWPPRDLEATTQLTFSDNSRPLSGWSNRFQSTGFLSLNTSYS